MIRADCARCGRLMAKLSGLPACPACGPSMRIASVAEDPREWTETFGGRRREPVHDDGHRRNSVDDEEAASLFDSYEEPEEDE